MKVFGSLDLEIPRQFSGEFSVVSVESFFEEAICFVYASLLARNRVENLLLVFKDDFLGNQQGLFIEKLNAIADFGCKIYFYIKTTEFHLEKYTELTTIGMVVLVKSKH